MASVSRTQLSSVFMPTAGLGCWQASGRGASEVGQAVTWALDAGIRMIDSAFAYQNEKEVGEAIRNAIKAGKIRREELFIVTKLPILGMRPEDVNTYFESSLSDLGLDYLDLYLIHGPFGVQADEKTKWFKWYDGKVKYHWDTDLVAVWRQMEKLVDSGKCKSIGVSNFNSDQLERVSKAARIPIAVNQIECNAFYQQKKLRETMDKLGIKVMAYAPIGSPGRSEPKPGKPALPKILEDSTVTGLAKKYKKTPAQVLLRHLVQLGFIVIPKSVKQHRIKENFDIFDFTLDPSEMEAMAALDKGTAGRTFDVDFLPSDEDITKLPEYPYIARDEY